jgi:hypothetical protein
MVPEINISGFQEIQCEEQRKINGGAVPIIAAFAVAIFEVVISDWDNFKNGLLGRPEEKKQP